MNRATFLLMAVLVLAVAVGCGGGSPRLVSFDRPEATVGEFVLSGASAMEDLPTDEDLVARHQARESIALTGRGAERLGAITRDGARGLGLIPDMVIMTEVDSDAQVEALLALARTARSRWALGLPTDAVVSIHPEFGDVKGMEGATPALLFDMKDARWRSRGAEVRDVRMNRLPRGTVYSLPSVHIVFASLRGPGLEDDGLAGESGLRGAAFGASFEALERRPNVPMVEQPASDGNGVWIVGVDKRSVLLPAPGGMSFSNALLERRNR